MSSLHQQLTDLLLTDERLISNDGQLLKNQAQELARKNDPKLIKSLLSDQLVREHFFVAVDETMIFDKDKFIRFITSKQFLPDSYTAYKNKVGLTVNGSYLSENKEVVLSWPYKDCVLEGGMTKEEQNQDEIFFNEILAPDEINRLLDSKVFTNFKRLDKDGQHDFDDFRRDEKGRIRDNLVIKGNNLLVISSLLKEFTSRIKLIYIDPPFNTGGASETFTYNNDFNHSSWLTFIRNRLEIAKKLLTEDGFIAIAIDHVELFYLGCIADEIFDRDNRIGIVTVVHKPEGRQHSKFFSPSNEYMLVYAKNRYAAEFNKVVLTDQKKGEFTEKDDIGNFKWKNFIRGDVLRSGKDGGFYPIYVSEDLKDITLIKQDGYTAVLPIDNQGTERAWIIQANGFLEKKDSNEIRALRNKFNKLEIQYKIREQQVFTTHWVDKRYNATAFGTNLLRKIIGKKSVSYPKSLYTVLDTLKIMTRDDDIILDFFAGSGTTGHATIELNRADGGKRSFILVEQLEEHINICQNRLNHVMKNDSAQPSVLESTEPVSYVSMELAKWNEKLVEEILNSRTKDELLAIWKKMRDWTFLSANVNKELTFLSADDLFILPIGEIQKFLIELLDKNNLYINFSEISDNEYGVPDFIKNKNDLFYFNK